MFLSNQFLKMKLILNLLFHHSNQLAKDVHEVLSLHIWIMDLMDLFSKVEKQTNKQTKKDLRT